MTLYKDCSNEFDLLKNMAARVRSVFAIYIGKTFKMSWQKLPVRFRNKLAQMIQIEKIELKLNGSSICI